MAESTYMNPAARQAQSDRWLPASAGPVNVGLNERVVSQVAGGVMLAYGLTRGTLGGLATAALGGMLVYRGATGHCSLYQLLGVNTAEEARGLMNSVPAQQGSHVEESVTVNRSPEECFRYWRDVTNLPRFMADVISVQPAGENRTHWVARGPFGSTLEWDAETYNEAPNEMLAWRSLPGSEVQVAGSVHFTPAPGNRGTVVRVVQKTNPPGGQLGIAVAKIFGEDPARRVAENLRRFKQLLEAGEVATIEGQPHGPR